jgi:hypothetical protein
MEHCNGNGKCENLARCACGVPGRRCTSLCHGGIGNNKLCAMYDDLEECSDEEDASIKEDVTASAEAQDPQPIT